MLANAEENDSVLSNYDGSSLSIFDHQSLRARQGVQSKVNRIRKRLTSQCYARCSIIVKTNKSMALDEARDGHLMTFLKIFLVF